MNQQSASNPISAPASPSLLAWAGIALSILLFVGVAIPSKTKSSTASQRPDTPALFGFQDPRDIANSFVNESDPLKRLQFVRNATEVKSRMLQYPEQALREPAKILTQIPIHHLGTLTYARFVAEFENGDRRLLCIVDTPEGPKVDWDCYARHGTASWADLAAGKVPEATMRAFVGEGDYYNYHYSDDQKWVCYQLTTPDHPHPIHSYVPRKSELHHQLYRSLASDDLNIPSSRFVLRIARSEISTGHGQYEIKEVIVNGWVTPDPAGPGDRPLLKKGNKTDNGTHENLRE